MRREAGDGGLPCDVYLDGQLVNGCVIADTTRGKVVCFRYPLVLDKFRKRCLRTTKYGRVEIVPRGMKP